jgi:hypothetical protein
LFADTETESRSSNDNTRFRFTSGEWFRLFRLLDFSNDKLSVRFVVCVGVGELMLVFAGRCVVEASNGDDDNGDPIGGGMVFGFR